MDVKENAHLIEGIVGIFDKLSEEESIASGGFGSQRELAQADLEDFAREELIAKSRQADAALGTLGSLSAEMDNLPLMVALCDARNRVEAALETVTQTLLSYGTLQLGGRSSSLFSPTAAPASSIHELRLW